jgi:hypothetical protein
MSRWGAIGDAVTGLGKGLSSINPQALKLGSGIGDLGKAGDALKASGGLGDALKSGGALGDLGKLGKVGGGAAADAGKAGGAAADAGKAAGAAGDAAKGLNKVDDVGAAAKGANKADDLGGAAKGANKADDVAKTTDDAKGVLDWAKKNPGKALAGAGASAAALYAANEYTKNDGKKVGITKIEAASEGGVLGLGATNVAKITFTPEMDALNSDTLKIEGTDCVPSIDGPSVAIFKVYSPTMIGIKLEKALTGPGSKGSLTLSTTLAARAGAAAGAGAGAVAGVAGGAAGGAMTSFFQGLGIPLPDGLPGMLIIGCIALFVLFILFKIFF